MATTMIDQVRDKNKSHYPGGAVVDILVEVQRQSLTGLLNQETRSDPAQSEGKQSAYAGRSEDRTEKSVAAKDREW